MRFVVVIEYDIPEEGEHYPVLGLNIIEEQMSPGTRIVRSDALIRTPADLVCDVVAQSSVDPVDG